MSGTYTTLHRGKTRRSGRGAKTHTMIRFACCGKRAQITAPPTRRRNANLGDEDAEPHGERLRHGEALGDEEARAAEGLREVGDAHRDDKLPLERASGGTSGCAGPISAALRRKNPTRAAKRCLPFMRSGLKSQSKPQWNAARMSPTSGHAATQTAQSRTKPKGPTYTARQAQMPKATPTTQQPDVHTHTHNRVRGLSNEERPQRQRMEKCARRKKTKEH